MPTLGEFIARALSTYGVDQALRWSW